MSVRLTPEEIRLVARLRGSDIARVYSKKGKLLYSGSVEDCIWYCKGRKQTLTIDIMPADDNAN